jgi:outer membrane protein assembly factor BamB
MTDWNQARNCTLALLFCGLVTLTSLSRALVAQTEQRSDWTRWRGPTGNGIVEASNDVPLQWSETENVVWKVKVPGRGHSSPIITQGRIFLTTADSDAQTQSVLCLDQNTGEQRWTKVVNQGGFPSKIHGKNTHASQTVAVAGNRVLAVFYHHGAIHGTCIDLDGNLIWQKKIADYESENPFGYGSSPIVAGGRFIVLNDNANLPALIALDVDSGEAIWTADRSLPAGFKTENGWTTSYATPVVADIGGSQQLLVSGVNRVASYNPQTGEELWKCQASWDVACGTMVWDEQSNVVIASGGYPTKETLAVKADGSGERVWTNKVKCYEQSMAVVDGYVYGQAEQGIIHCWSATDGTLQWRERFEGPESASPVVIGDHILFTSEKGNTLVVRANPKKFEKVRVNHLGDSAFASMAVCNDRIYTRVAKKEGVRLQEFLYCLGK